MEFNPDQIERYSRHVLLRDVGGEGQKKLMQSSVLMVGAGGLGSPALLYLAAAGVGRIGVADADRVEISNLQRQVIHDTSDVGRDKVESAKDAIRSLNPDCEVETFPERITEENASRMVAGFDLVLDGTDNFPTRFLVADCCWFEKKPLVTAAAVQFQGQIMAVLPGDGNPCYRCCFPEPPPPGTVSSCREAGVLGAVVGVMGTLQAVEAVKVLLGLGDDLSKRLVVYDAMTARFMNLKRKPDPACRLCGPEPRITELREQSASCEYEQPDALQETGA